MKKVSVIVLTVALSCMSVSFDTTMRVCPEVVKSRTDYQIDSMYRNHNTDMLTDAVRNNFRDLRAMIDSNNAETLLAISRANQAAEQRDSAKTALLNVIWENIRLREQNTQYERQILIISKFPDVVYMFLVVILGTLLSLGIYNGYVNRKTSNEK